MAAPAPLPRSRLREAWRTFRIARDLADAYGSLAVLLPVLYVASATVPIAFAAAVVSLATVLLFPALQPWGFLAPVALVALAVGGFALALWVLLRALPRRARALLASARAAGGHARERTRELAELSKRGSDRG